MCRGAEFVASASAFQTNSTSGQLCSAGTKYALCLEAIVHFTACPCEGSCFYMITVAETIVELSFERVVC